VPELCRNPEAVWNFRLNFYKMSKYLEVSAFGYISQVKNIFDFATVPTARVRTSWARFFFAPVPCIVIHETSSKDNCMHPARLGRALMKPPSFLPLCLRPLPELPAEVVRKLNIKI
jgi:hypothetical protein